MVPGPSGLAILRGQTFGLTLLLTGHQGVDVLAQQITSLLCNLAGANEAVAGLGRASTMDDPEPHLAPLA